MEDLEDKITTEQERKKEAEEKLQNRNKLLVGIREGLDHLVTTLVSDSLDRTNLNMYLDTPSFPLFLFVVCQRSHFCANYQKLNRVIVNHYG